MRALLCLEDGTWFAGESFGAPGEAFGEVVFNTGMSGYQEVLTDPSYAAQIVVMTSPHQGNYGVNREDAESDRIQVAGFAVREASRRSSSWRAEHSLQDELAGAGVPGIEGFDTRALTLHIRERGAMRAAISTEDMDPGSLAERARAAPGMEGADLARTVSTPRPYAAAEVGVETPEPRFRVAAYDWGLKRSILRRLAAAGCEVTVVPAQTPAQEVAGYDGVFLSNGPGDPAATRYAIEITKGLLGEVPVFGICLGHRIMGLALGGRSYKLTFGHRGANQPVQDRDTGQVAVTSHNHGFALDPAGWERDGDRVRTDLGEAVLTHWNLNDGTLEGLRLLDVPAFCVQYHPEAAPGPHDARGLFDRFVTLMERA